MPKIEAFERYCDVYDAWFQENAETYADELELIRRLMSTVGDMTVEVGSGSGRFAVPLGIGIGVEPSRAMARLAQQRGVQVIAGVAENLPLATASFNQVLMVTVVCFIDDVPTAFAEAGRVLKPGGSLIVGFVDKESELGKTYAASRDSDPFYCEATFFSAREVADHMESAGFRIERAEQALVPGEPAGRILDGYGRGAFVGIQGFKRHSVGR